MDFFKCIAGFFNSSYLSFSAVFLFISSLLDLVGLISNFYELVFSWYTLALIIAMPRYTWEWILFLPIVSCTVCDYSTLPVTSVPVRNVTFDIKGTTNRTGVRRGLDMSVGKPAQTLTFILSPYVHPLFHSCGSPNVSLSLRSIDGITTHISHPM